MTLDRFEEAWRADKSTIGPEELMRTLRQIEREGRVQTVLQCVCAVITLGMTALITATVPDRDLPNGLLRMAVSLAAMSVVAILIRRRIERRRRFQGLFRCVNDAAAGALQDTREQINHLKALAGLACFIVPLLAFAVYKLHLSEKMDAKSVAGFAVLTGTVLLVNIIGWGFYFQRTLRPRRQRLEAFVAALGE